MLELFRLVVQDQRVREIYLLQQRIDVVILGNGKGDVGITTQDNRYFVLLAKALTLWRTGFSELLLISSSVPVSLAAWTMGSNSKSAVPSPG